MFNCVCFFCDRMDCSPPGSVPGIFPARMLESVAISSSRVQTGHWMAERQKRLLLLNHVRVFTIPWTTARQAFLSFTISQSLLKFMSIEFVISSHHLIICHPLFLLSFTIPQSLLKFVSIESVISSNHLIICHPLFLLPSIFPSIRVFSMTRLLASDGQSIGTSASASVLPMNIQGWFPLGLTGSCACQGGARPGSRVTGGD